MHSSTIILILTMTITITLPTLTTCLTCPRPPADYRVSSLTFLQETLNGGCDITQNGLGDIVGGSRDAYAIFRQSSLLPGQFVDEYVDSPGGGNPICGNLNNVGGDDVYLSYPATALMNSGNGDTLTPSPVGIARNVHSYTPHIVDLDGDMDNDVIQPEGPNLVLSFNTNGDGSAWSTSSYSGCTNPATGHDLNSDGYLEIVCGQQASSRVLLLTSNGVGGYTESHIATPGLSTWYTAMGNLDGDSAPDIVASGLSNLVLVLWNDGSNGFSSASSTPIDTDVQTHGLTLADIENDDGILDIVYMPWRGDLGEGQYGLVRVAPNNGNRNFGSPIELPVTDDHFGIPISLAGDIYLEGTPTLLFAKYGASPYSLSLARLGQMARGIGGYTQVTPPTDPWCPHSRIESADINLDGWLDLVVWSGCTSTITYHTSSSSATSFDTTGLLVASATPPSLSALKLADLDGNANIDVAWSSPTSSNVWFALNRGPSNPFYAPTLLSWASLGATSSSIHDIAIGPLPDSSFVDIVAAGDNELLLAQNPASSSPSLSILVSGVSISAVAIAPPSTIIYATPTSIHSITLPSTTPTLITSSAPSLTHLALADADADGVLDIFWASSTTGIIGLVNMTAFPAPSTTLRAGATGITSFRVRDYTRNGYPDVLYTSPSLNTSRVIFCKAPGDYTWSDQHIVAGPIAAHVPDVVLEDFNLDGVTDAAYHLSSPLSGVAVTFGSGSYTQHSGPPHVAPAFDTNLPECAGLPSSVACVASALARIPRCGGTGEAVVTLPRGHVIDHCVRVDGGSGYIEISRDLTFVAAPGPGPNPRFDCSATGGGVLFRVSDPGITLTLDGVDIKGGSAVADFSSSTAWSTFRLAADDASLVLRSLSVWDTGSINANQAQSGEGGLVFLSHARNVLSMQDVSFTNVHTKGKGGVVYVQGGDAVITCANCVGHDISAVGSGGLLHIDGPNGDVTFSNVSFTQVVSHKGSGGVISVSATALDSRVALHDTVLSDVSAPTGIGGALFVSGFGQARIDVTGSSRIVRPFARWGGVGGACLESLFYPPTPAPLLLATATPSGGDTLVQIVLADTVSVSEPSAVYGGLVAACFGYVNATGLVLEPGSPFPSAQKAGGAAFVCPPADVTTWVDLPPWFENSVSDGWAPVLASAPMSLSVSQDPPAQRPSGLPLGAGAVSAFDGFGQRVVDTGLALRAATDATFVELGGVSSGLYVDLSSQSASLASMVLTSNEWPATLGTSFTLTFSVFAYDGSNPTIASLPPGFFPTASATLAVSGCPPGYGRVSDPTTPLLCAQCPAGTFSLNTSALPCEIELSCGGNAVFKDGECQVCPSNTFRTYLNDSLPGPCTCDNGFWNPRQALDELCFPCPEGARCGGRQELPIAISGWAPTGSPSSGRFHECLIPSACLGAGVCSSQYQQGSLLCKDCAPGFYRASDRTCVSCPSNSVGAGLVVLLLAIVMVSAIISYALVLWTFVSVAMNEEDDSNNMALRDSRSKLIPHSVSVLVVYCQVVALLATIPTLPKSVERVMLWASLVNIDISLFTVECSVPSFYTRYVMNVCIPLVFMICVVLTYAAFRVFPGCCPGRLTREHVRQVSLSEILRRMLFSMGPLIYVPLCTVTIRFFDCTELPDGKFWMDADPSQECFSGQWLAMAPVAICAFVLYVAAMPCFFSWILYANRHRLDDTRVLLLYAPIYSVYRRKHFYSEVAHLLKRLAIVAAATFFSRLEVWLFSSLVTVFATATVWQVRHEPYYQPAHNRLELRCNIAAFILVMVGVMFWAVDSPSEGTFLVLVTVAFITLGVSLVLLLLAVFSELHERRQSRKQVQGFLPHDIQRDRMFAVVASYLPDIRDPSLRESMEALRHDSMYRGGWTGGDPKHVEMDRDAVEKEFSSADSSLSSGRSAGRSNRRRRRSSRRGFDKSAGGSVGDDYDGNGGRGGGRGGGGGSERGVELMGLIAEDFDSDVGTGEVF